MGGPSLKAVAQPYLIMLYERKYLLVLDSILVTDNQKLLVKRHQLRHILPKQRERRVGNDDVGLLQKLDALAATEVAITL